METPAAAHKPWSIRQALRFAWTAVSSFAVESLVVGCAALPAALFFRVHTDLDIGPEPLRLWVLAMAAIPTYLIFSVALMALSAGAMRVLGWWPPQRAELPIADLDWELCNWARYGVSNHLVRVLAGTFLRTTPLWTAYMRWNGARLGRRVWINSLDVVDHCLLDFGDDVVVGAGAHLSGHTVERGCVRTAPVTLGRGVTVGVNANVEIGVVAGDRCQIGALSAVPKFVELEAGATYAGIPARRLPDKRRRDAGSGSAAEGAEGG